MLSSLLGTTVALCALVCAATAGSATAVRRQPNIVWFLTDDQDQMLGASFPEINGVGPMPKTKEKLATAGAMAENFYIHTPICNPSRSELLSGRYFHNIKTTKTPEWAMHVDEAAVNNNFSFAIALKEKAGYNTGMFGKYMNVMPSSVPPGWDAWMVWKSMDRSGLVGWSNSLTTASIGEWVCGLCGCVRIQMCMRASTVTPDKERERLL